MYLSNLFIFWVLTLTAITCNAQSRSAYGETCDKTLRCDPRASLSCTNGTCHCLQTDEMVYDFGRKKCVVLSGERCRYTAVEIAPDQSDGRRYTEILDCVENAACQHDGYCSCNDEYFANSKRVCVRKRKHHRSCTKDEECDYNLKFICLNGKCSCNGSVSVYDFPREKCVQKTGTTCKNTEDCVRYATCRDYGYPRNFHCACIDNYFETAKGTCKKKYTHGDNCSASDECNANLKLICANGTCSCDEAEALYDYQRNQCVLKVGNRGSNLHNKYYHCVANANKNRGSTCVCNEDYKENSNGECSTKHKFGYGSRCTDDEDCEPSFICVNNQCSCTANTKFDSKPGLCFIKAREACGKLEWSQSRVQQCGRNSICSEEEKTDYASWFSCKCFTGFQEVDGSCYGNVTGAGCDNKYFPCLNDLVCNDNKCSCPFPSFQYFNENSGKCISYLHGPCYELVNGNLTNFPCNGNLECRNDYGISECLCPNGFIESGSRWGCKRVHGSKCETTSECDSVAGLACWNGTCACKDFEEYDEILKRCLGLVGAKCGIVEGRNNITCTESADCKPSRSGKLSSLCRCRPGYIVNDSRKCVRLEIDVEQSSTPRT